MLESPEDVMQGIMAALERVIAMRNAQIGEPGKIGITYQVDDPKRPGKLKIDIDTPSPNGESKDAFLARLEIDKITGAMELFPSGATPSETFPAFARQVVVQRMSSFVHAAS